MEFGKSGGNGASQNSVGIVVIPAYADSIQCCVDAQTVARLRTLRHFLVQPVCIDTRLTTLIVVGLVQGLRTQFIKKFDLNLQAAPLELSGAMAPVYYKLETPTEPTAFGMIERSMNLISDKAA